MTRKNRNELLRSIAMVLISFIAGLSAVVFFKTDMITGITQVAMCLSVAVCMRLQRYE